MNQELTMHASPFAFADQNIDALLRTGLYQSKDELVSEAVRNLLLNNKPLRLELALELFRADEVSLGRATEIAGLNRWAFQEALHERNIPIIVEPEFCTSLIRTLI